MQAADFWSWVNKDGPLPEKRPELGPCWLWKGPIKPNGYGSYAPPKATNPERRTVNAHRYAYLLAVGPLPEGLDCDHLCERRSCVNPTHLEPVPHRVNMLRGNTIVARAAAATHCPSGHPYDAENTRYRSNGNRVCKTCDRDRQRERRRCAADAICLAGYGQAVSRVAGMLS